MPRLGLRRARSAVTLGSMIIGALASASVAGTEVSHGEMAGAIRSANYPCAHVLRIDGAGDNQWVVQCNSGTFHVSRDQAGRFTVSQAPGKTEK